LEEEKARREREKEEEAEKEKEVEVEKKDSITGQEKMMKVLQREPMSAGYNYYCY
jgi:hypothetical protein